MNPGFTLWLTGLPGAGKTTLATGVWAELVRRALRVEVPDGDEVRMHLSRDLGFSKRDRDENVRRLGFVARLLSSNGVIAIIAAVSPYREARECVRRSHDARRSISGPTWKASTSRGWRLYAGSSRAASSANATITR